MAILLCSLVISGCGGGNASNTRPGSLAISATVSPETVELGHAVTLTITAPGAFACSTLNSGEMQLQGLLPLSVMEVPVNVGTTVYAVQCENFAGAVIGSATSNPVTVTPNLLSTLAQFSNLGSVVGGTQSDRRPYGLLLAATTSGLISAGDLIACTFNDADGNVGRGMTLVGLPAAGGSPYVIARDAALLGCNGLAALPDGTLVASASTSGLLTFVSTTGAVSNPLPPGTFSHPGGVAYAQANGTQPAALYVSDIDLTKPDGGTIYRVTLDGDSATSVGLTNIVHGFCTSRASNGALFGPGGLTYDGATDTLYFADPSSSTIVGVQGISTFIPNTRGAGVLGQCTPSPPTPPLLRDEITPYEDNVQFIAQGGSLFTPVGVALLPNGELVAVNGDLPLSSGETPPAPNLLLEVSPFLGAVVGQPVQADTGPGGALGNVIVTTRAQDNPIIYYTDGNTDSVMSLSH